MDEDKLSAKIVHELMAYARGSREPMVQINAGTLFDAVNYKIAEGSVLNCKRQNGTYLHKINFMGIKFYAVSKGQAYNSDDFFEKRPAR